MFTSRICWAQFSSSHFQTTPQETSFPKYERLPARELHKHENQGKAACLGRIGTVVLLDRAAPLGIFRQHQWFQFAGHGKVIEDCGA
jgi:hypothetical protein